MPVFSAPAVVLPQSVPAPTIPGSWLVAYCATPVTSSVSLPWTFGASAGSDINIDGGDDTVINIVTPGVYEIMWSAGILGDATAAGQIVSYLDGTIDGQDWLNWLSSSGPSPPTSSQTLTPPNYNSDLTVTVPAVRVLTAVTVKVTGGFSLTAGTAQLGTAGWILVRRID